LRDIARSPAITSGWFAPTCVLLTHHFAASDDAHPCSKTMRVERNVRERSRALLGAAYDSFDWVRSRAKINASLRFANLCARLRHLSFRPLASVLQRF
jgi:hypothetical protein